MEDMHVCVPGDSTQSGRLNTGAVRHGRAMPVDALCSYSVQEAMLGFGTRLFRH